ncbi:hypothetical protein [Serratia silvae]|uniref:FidL-like membrane protein n=1 Tax=Serratia silvae TaxID=2824122 RepID=A0ABT0KBK1_9GAMM|nr:hypothetical protein [Serratia silvae]MCL1029403.1 hypothetical protein [Serratia silvae]
MKKFVVALLLLICLSTMLFYVYQFASYRPFHCDAQLFEHLNVREGDSVEVNTHVDIIFTAQHHGSVKFSGSVKNQGHSYVLRRTTFFTVSPSELDNVEKMVFTRTESHPVDNTPEELWQHRVLPQTPGIEFYSKIRALNRDAIILKGFSNPLIICIRR